jgi:hypothetical protein
LEVKLQDGQTVETLTTAAEILGLPKDKREGVNSRNLWKALKEAGMTEKVASIKFGDHVDEETRRLFK